MTNMDEKRSLRLKQALRDMENNGVKLRKPEELHSRNASLCRVTAFNECSNTAGLIYIILGIGKMCLCDTNFRLSHKDPCPERGNKSLQSRN